MSGKPPARALCPGCGYEPCRGNCPRHVLYDEPVPFAPTQIVPIVESPYNGRPISSTPPFQSAKWNEPTEPIADRIRAWRDLEKKATAWLEMREHAERDGRGTSPSAIRRAEAEMIRAIETARRIRKENIP